MIRTLTIVENRAEEGKVEYSISGGLPIDEAAKALVIIAYSATNKNAGDPSDIVKGDPPRSDVVLPNKS
jgi:hypothetical protein